MELHYFLTTNGSMGRTSFLEAELAGYRDIIRLEGYPRSLAAKLVRECYAEAKKHTLDIEVIHNALDNSPEGILFPGLGTGLINMPLYDVNFGLPALFVNESLAQYHRHMQKAYHCFKEALAIHDDWETIYKSATDYAALNAITEEIIRELLTDRKTDYKGHLCDRFFGSASVNGSIDYIDVLSEGQNRYFVKGRPGTGKSTFMKKLAIEAYERGFHVERYHCSFDPNSLDMVIVRELNLCIFDSTAPHEYFPTDESDEVIDLYEAAVAQDTDTVNEKAIKKISRMYKDAIGKALKHLIVANDAALAADEENLKQIENDRVMLVLCEIFSRIFP
ncbi:MAG: hypothetical protein IKL80_02195 [Clostridia bacterium]|nr:hypothetical protein [Clostridia bacterium]